MQQINYKYIILVFVFFLSFFRGKAEVTIDARTQVIQLASGSGIYADSASKSNLYQFREQTSKLKVNQEIPNLGLSRNTWWIETPFHNVGKQQSFMVTLNQPILNDVTFYLLKDGKLVDSLFAGESLSFNSRKISTSDPSFIFDLSENECCTLITKIRSNATLVLDLRIGAPLALLEEEHDRDIFLSFYYGIIIVTFLYNLFVFLSGRESIYSYYVIYIFLLFFIQFSIDGFAARYLWPHSAWLNQQSFFLFTAFVNIAGLEFARRFINSKEHLPRIDKFHYVLYIIYFIICGVSMAGYRYEAYKVILPLAGVSASYMLLTGMIIGFRGYRPARFFLIAWTPLIIGIAVSVMKGFNLLGHHWYTNYSIQIGTALEVILLSLALADKINIYRLEREQAREAELKLTLENQSLIQNQKETLEIQVQERTFALNEAMESLKNAQSQLVESEKMSSLGQLTAGLAHEINNPVNFISSTIGPLRRDVEDILTLIRMYDSLNLSEQDLPGMREIIKYKKDVDYEFLQEEMPQLFEAIADGSRRTAAIINGLKSFSRVDELDLKFVDLHEGIDSTLMLLKQQMGAKLSVEKVYAELPQVECYAGKINQVFMNIIGNAVYALNHSGKSEQWLRIMTHFDAQFAYITISDNGNGIPAEVQSRIFEPFYTTKPVGEGTGLGLSIVFSIIETHKGQIALESAIGVGTAFKITLPLKQ